METPSEQNTIINVVSFIKTGPLIVKSLLRNDMGNGFETLDIRVKNVKIIGRVKLNMFFSPSQGFYRSSHFFVM